eukprot:tig00000070_g24430.t1
MGIFSEAVKEGHALKGSPSLAFNNLSSGGSHLAYVHLNEVVLIPEAAVQNPSGSTPTRVAYKDGAPVMQAKFVTIGSAVLLVLATENGVQVFDKDGTRLIFNHSIPVAKGTDRSRFCRGICSVSDGEKEYLCVGTSLGEVLVFLADREEFSLVRTMTGHKFAITDIASDKSSELFASGDDEGSIHVWAAGSFEKQCTFLGSGHPCSSLGFHGKRQLAAGYSTGTIAIFDVASKRKTCAIDAHSRTINAMDVSPSRGLIASASEDQYVHVWSYTASPQPEVKLE